MGFAIMNKYEAYVHNLKDNSIKTKGRKLCYLINVFHIACMYPSAKLICSIKRRRLSIASRNDDIYAIKISSIACIGSAGNILVANISR
jgi:hypothetical protein